MRILGNENWVAARHIILYNIFIYKTFYHTATRAFSLTGSTCKEVDQQSLRRHRSQGDSRQGWGGTCPGSWPRGLRRRLCVECPEFPTPTPQLSVPTGAFLGHSHQHRNLVSSTKDERVAAALMEKESELAPGPMWPWSTLQVRPWAPPRCARKPSPALCPRLYPVSARGGHESTPAPSQCSLPSSCSSHQLFLSLPTPHPVLLPVTRRPGP